MQGSNGYHFESPFSIIFAMRGRQQPYASALISDFILPFVDHADFPE
jgi:hypothetical protein